MKRFLYLSTLISASAVTAAVDPFTYTLNSGSDFIYYNSNYNAFNNDSTNGYYRTYGLEQMFLDVDVEHSNGVRFETSLRPDALVARQGNVENPTEYDTRAGRVYVPMSDLKFLNTYKLAFAPNKNFEVAIGVEFDFAKNQRAYEPMLEFGLNTLFPQKYSFVSIEWVYQKDYNIYPDGKNISKGGVKLSLINSKDDRHEILAPNESTDDTSNASTNDYFGVGFNGILPVRSNIDLSANVGFVGSDNASLDASQSQIFFSLSALYRYSLAGIKSAVGYEFRFNKDSFSQTEKDIPDLVQYSQSITNVHKVRKKLDILWGIHQGGSDNLDSSFESRVKYLGLQVDFGLRQKVRPNFTMNYWFDYEQRALDSEGSKKGGFTIDGSDHKYLLRYAISAHYRFNS